MKPGFTVGETARICSIPADTLRYYDKIGLIRPMEKRRNERHRIWKKILRSAWQAAGLMTCCSATLWRSWDRKISGVWVHRYVLRRKEISFRDDLTGRVRQGICWWENRRAIKRKRCLADRMLACITVAVWSTWVQAMNGCWISSTTTTWKSQGTSARFFLWIPLIRKSMRNW